MSAPSDAHVSAALARALEAAGSGVAIADARAPGTPVLHVNAAFERLLGRSREDALGTSALALLLEIADEEDLRALWPALGAGSEHEATLRCRPRDGDPFDAHARFLVVRDDEGRVAQWIVVVDDVSQRAALRRDLAAAEARYRSLVEQMPATTYVAEWTAEAPVRYISPQIRTLLGWTPEEFVADPGLWARTIHPADRDRVLAEVRRTYEQQESFDVEYRMLGRDGREVWVWDKDVVLRDDEGRPTASQGVLLDVTALRRTEHALRQERDRAQRYLDVAGAIIVALDLDERVLLLNRAGQEVLGFGEADLAGRDFFEAVVPEEERELTRALFHEHVANDPGDADLFECEVVAADGQRRAIAWHTTVLRDDEGRATATLSSGVDLTERRAAEQQIAYLAYHDSLTGLPNRALLAEHLELALARAQRSGQAVALLYLDLDDFKLVNDSLGHPAGDELLCHIALRLGERRREMDLLARQGGDEFLLLLADLDRPDAEGAARRVADGLLRALQRPFTIAGAEFHTGASVGISLFPADAGNADQLLAHADAAMYAAKAAGRNGVALYDGDPNEPLERLSMTSRLRKALARRELVVHWQPIVDPADRTLHKLEALVRWNDPLRGLVLPSEFIPFAEDTGLIDRVGDWVLEAVADQVDAWARRGLAVPEVTVNVSPRQLRRPDFADRVRRRLEGAPPGVLTVEITESAAMSDPLRVEPALQELHDAGVRIAVDDFGAGYSSLTRLRRLPVQVLKIDRSFLQGVPEDGEAAAIVTAIVELAAALGMEAVAEGVETEAQREFLIGIGCPLAQGFLLGRPAPAADVEPLLARAGARATGP
ncbi:MAG: EAL domain-containing protein [Solirubrobacterales bacterium]|nr:EAL domain-containing protein [Solirubrobacterales bacterium]